MWSLIKGKKNHIKHETNTTLLPDEPEEHSAERWALIGASAKGAHDKAAKIHTISNRLMVGRLWSWLMGPVLVQRVV